MRTPRIAVLVIMCSLLVAGGLYAEYPKSIDQVAAHLEFMGYTITRGEKYVTARKDGEAVVTIRLHKDNMLFSAYYNLDKTQGTNEELLQAVNSLNLNAAACRYYIDEDGDLAIEMLIPDTYDRALFGNIFTLWQKESRATVADESNPIYPFVL
jgi:hypothetical protein